MPLKAKIANKSIADSQGYITAKLTGIEIIDAREEKQKGKTIKWAEQFRFDFESKGSSKAITYQVWTGQNINSEKLENGDYNKLTRVCLQLGLLKESQLKDGKVPTVDLEELIGKQVKFKLENSINRPGLKIPNIRTFVLSD